MKLRIAVVAACTGTLGFAQADFALANSGSASHLVGRVSSTDVRPERGVVLAQSAPVNTTRSDKKAGVVLQTAPLESVSFTYGRKLQPAATARTSKSKEANSALGQVSTTRGRLVAPAAPCGSNCERVRR